MKTKCNDEIIPILKEVFKLGHIIECAAGGNRINTIKSTHIEKAHRKSYWVNAGNVNACLINEDGEIAKNYSAPISPQVIHIIRLLWNDRIK